MITVLLIGGASVLAFIGGVLFGRRNQNKVELALKLAEEQLAKIKK
jgi:hypothetical protein